MRGKVSQIGNQLVHKHGSEILVIEPWGRDGLRVRATILSKIDNTAWALTEDLNSAAAWRVPAVQIQIGANEATITNGQIAARIYDNKADPRQQNVLQAGYLQFFNGNKLLLSEFDYVVGAHNPGTRNYRPVPSSLSDSELSFTEVHFAPQNEERFYGMGLNATGSVNLKGSVIDLYQRHVKHVVPFLVSSAGYGLLWNNPSLGRVELGRNRTRWVSEGCKQIDYYITTGANYAEIMGNYASVTGHAPEMPYWATGFWQCKLRYKCQEELLEVAREFKRRDLPLSVIVIDFRHWKNIGDWKLDSAFWPNPKEMVRELEEMGVRVMISPWILVEEESENFAAMRELGFFIDSLDAGEDWLPWMTAGRQVRARQYDPTNPKAAAFLWQQWKRNYFDLGIRTFWLDPCDDLHPIGEYGRTLYHIGPGLAAHGFYPIAHQKNIHDALHRSGEHEVVTICRSSWAGSQRYGASPAAHDIKSSFEHLDEYMKAGLNLAMSGIPWGAAEIGGFVTPDNESKYFRELMVRWYQYGVFTPIFRTHGNRPNNEAWTIGGDSYSYIRASMLLRERLRPYVMKQMRVAATRGIPPMRPLFFDFESDAYTYSVENQFLFGPEIMVAPITSYLARNRKVYLPRELPWIDAWTGHVYEGGRTIAAAAPLEYIPVYLRGPDPEIELKTFDELY